MEAATRQAYGKEWGGAGNLSRVWRTGVGEAVVNSAHHEGPIGSHWGTLTFRPHVPW